MTLTNLDATVGVLMSTEVFGAELIERYLRSRGVQFFRGQHDGEYFFILKFILRPDFDRLHVHLEIPAADGESFAIQVTPDRFFPAANRPRLMRFAKRWNRRGGPAKAVVYRSIDPDRIGVAAEGFVPSGRSVHFDEFAGVVDHTIASAAKFFAELSSFVELPAGHSQGALLRDAS